MKPTVFLGLACLALSACQSVTPLQTPPTRAAMLQAYTPAAAPPGAPDGSCWGKDVTPAVIETVTEHLLLQPAQVNADGTVLAPALYKTETQQRIVRGREELHFETPCLDQITGEFVSNLQRALKARGHYKGAVTGQLDRSTQRAVRGFQAPQGLDSSILSLAAARQLGLLPYPRDT